MQRPRLKDGFSHFNIALSKFKIVVSDEMKNDFLKWIGLVALIFALTMTAPVLAQEESNKASQPEPTAEEIEKENEIKEAETDLRESIQENLDSLHEDVESVEKHQAEEQIISSVKDPDQTDAATQETETADTEKSQIEEIPASKSVRDFLATIPEQLQSVPERLPFLRERGIIFFGRAELDYAHYSSGITKQDSGFRVRSLRAGLAKAYLKGFSIKAEIDLTDGDSNFADLYFRYRNKRFGLFTIGNQRVAQTLVNQTSRISRTFMEQALPAEAFGLGRRMALGWDLNKDRSGVHATIFGDDLNHSIGDSGFAGRVYFNPARSRFRLFHVAASMVSENMSRKSRFFAHPESRVTSVRFVDTGLFDDVTHQKIKAVELAGSRDSFMFRSEFFRASWNRTGQPDPVFKGYYFQASWAMTGESFSYTQGKFLRIRPQKPRGAWEVAVRYSQVDLNDAGIFGGEQRNVTAAVNWYSPGNQFRIMSNLIFVKTYRIAGNESPTIFQLRAQLHW